MVSVHEVTNNMCYTYLVYLHPIFWYPVISMFISVRKLTILSVDIFGEFGTTLYSTKGSGFPPIPNLLYVCPYLSQSTALQNFFGFLNFRSRDFLEYLMKEIGPPVSLCLDNTNITLAPSRIQTNDRSVWAVEVSSRCRLHSHFDQHNLLWEYSSCSTCLF